MLYAIGRPGFDFHELVTGSYIWIRMRPNKCGILLAVQEIQLSYREAGLGNRLGSTGKRRRQRRMIDTTMGMEEEVHMRRWNDLLHMDT